MAEQRLLLMDHLINMMVDPDHHCDYCEDEG